MRVRKSKLRQISVLILAMSVLECELCSAAQPSHAAVLPNVLTDARVSPYPARWTISDIVQVRRITGTAIQGRSRVAAFILEAPSLADGKNHYGLYQIDPARGRRPRKIAESDYMADLAWRPSTLEWTVRADFGSGVQLYTVKRSGSRKPILTNADTVLVGGATGIMPDSTNGPHRTGIVSYGWSPDGRRVWYGRLRRRDLASQEAQLDSGLVYDGSFFLTDPSVEAATTIASYELRVFDPADGSDRLVASSSALGAVDLIGFARKVDWVDASHLQYRQLAHEKGITRLSLWRYDLNVGRAHEIQGVVNELFLSWPTKDGYITIRHQGAINDLVEVALDGRVIKQYGSVNAQSLVAGSFWRSPRGDQFIYGTSLSNRNGLNAFPKGTLSKALGAIPEYLSACSFNIDLSFGLCSAESLSKAPELVSISTKTGEVNVLSRPNARYDAIVPLKTEFASWTNCYGINNTGYITFPRDYVAGKSYPALLVTHARDAKDYFARDWFQWEFPIQVMAEQGYFILSVNQPKRDPTVPWPDFLGGLNAGVEKQEFNQYLNPAASMEAAVEPLIASGAVNPKAVGIAGYSAGAEAAYFIISHSKIFSAASFGDDAGLIPSYFWGGPELNTVMKALYGGSPFETKYIGNYRKYSTAFRLSEVKTPLLQQFSSTLGAMEGLQTDQLFKNAGIPAELVDYPNESHVFYAPRDRASAMARALDWFNYWLVGRRDPAPAKADQYSRWDDMSVRWLQGHKAAGASVGDSGSKRANSTCGSSKPAQ